MEEIWRMGETAKMCKTKYSMCKRVKNDQTVYKFYT